jgi:hypothetical protein
MKTFLVENTRKLQTIRVTINQPPYEEENVLNKTGWKIKDCIIKEIHLGWDEDLTNPSHMDNDLTGENDDSN